MSIRRLIFTIISYLLIVCLLVVSFLFPDLYWIFLAFVFVSLFPLRFLKNKEQLKRQQILMDFSSSCDVDTYIKRTEEVMKKTVLNSESKFLDQINICLALITACENEKAEQILIELSRKQSKMGVISLMFYYRCCCEYFFHLNKVEEYHEIFEKMKDLTEAIKPKYRMNAIPLLALCECKYYVLTGENISHAKLYFDRLNLPNLPMNIISKRYILALIDLRLKDYEGATKRLKQLAEEKYDLVYVRNARKLLSEMNAEKDVDE